MDTDAAFLESIRGMSLGRGSIKRTKLVIGIDYGTTYSGVAFVLQNATDPKDIKIFTDWPGTSGENSEHYEKAPSVIAYASENPEQNGQDAWGYEVEAGSKSYSWTKLLLDASAEASKYDDPSLRSIMARGMLQLPRGKKPVDVVSDYLRHIHDRLINAITEKCGGPDILDVTPIEYWLTVPALWTDVAKETTKQAAIRAGFGTRKIDEINVIPEPEAAAMLALKTSASQTDELVKPNTGVLICDCGGGTVDITSYTIVKTEPRLVLHESSKGEGAKCGGTYIDRNLHQLLAKRYGKSFTSLPTERTGPGSRFMTCFESRKQQFSTSNTRKSYKIPLEMPDLKASDGVVPGYDKKYGDVVLHEKDMLECFEPVVKGILDLVKEQVEGVKKKKNQPPVKTIVLVGGLGMSKHVRDRLKQWCEEESIRMVTPFSGAWSAVAKGAALCGLGAVKIDKRFTRRHYGQEVARPYRKSLHERPGWLYNHRWKDPFTGETMVNGHMQWLVAKNTAFDDETEIVSGWTMYHSEGTQKTTSETLYSYSLDDAPDDSSSEGIAVVGKLVVNYEDIDFDNYEHRTDEDGDKVTRLPVRVYIKLGDRQGTLTFRTEIGGFEVGEATMDFSGH